MSPATAPENVTFEIAMAAFAKLFEGREDVYASGAGDPRPIRRELTPDTWRRHLTGQEPIGIYPLRPDGTVLWGCVDIDEPDFELGACIAERLPATCWIERTRSGNVHVWVFCAAPCPAWAAQGVLRLACAAEGRPDLECNPKQARLDLARHPKALGNLVRLPYAGDQRPMVWRSGDPLEFDAAYDLGEFVERATADRCDAGSWVAFAEGAGLTARSTGRRGDTEWGDGPTHPCLFHLFKVARAEGIPSGRRNTVLHIAARMLRHSRDFEDEDARALLEELNEECCERPLDRGEFERIWRGARGYTSPGCEHAPDFADPECEFA